MTATGVILACSPHTTSSSLIRVNRLPAVLSSKVPPSHTYSRCYILLYYTLHFTPSHFTSLRYIYTYVSTCLLLPRSPATRPKSDSARRQTTWEKQFRRERPGLTLPPAHADHTAPLITTPCPDCDHFALTLTAPAVCRSPRRRRETRGSGRR